MLMHINIYLRFIIIIYIRHADATIAAMFKKKSPKYNLTLQVSLLHLFLTLGHTGWFTTIRLACAAFLVFFQTCITAPCCCCECAEVALRIRTAQCGPQSGASVKKHDANEELKNKSCPFHMFTNKQHHLPGLCYLLAPANKLYKKAEHIISSKENKLLWFKCVCA